MLKILNGLIKPDAGKVTVRGRVGALIALGAGFNPLLTARENIMVNGAILGLSRKRIREVFDDIISFAEIEEFVDSPVRTLSSGMTVRLGFAIAAHMEPDVLLIDEVLAVGDLSFRRKCLRFVEGFRENGGAFILVTHNLNQILSSCKNAILLEKGSVVASGPSVEVVNRAIGLQFSEKSASPGQRLKTVETENKSVAIISAGLFSGDGDDPVCGREAVAQIRVRSRLDADDVTWALYIWSDDFSRRLLSLQSSDFEKVDTIRAGSSYEFRCRLPVFPLAPGRYGLRFSIHAHGELQDSVGYEDDWIWTHIRPASVSTQEVRRAAVGDLVWADCLWEEAKAMELDE
ncbi:ABC-type polysaccharide/polyol phosphate transport system ATPase subunit [Puniceicoccus vermicola]